MRRLSVRLAIGTEAPRSEGKGHTFEIVSDAPQLGFRRLILTKTLSQGTWVRRSSRSHRVNHTQHSTRLDSPAVFHQNLRQHPGYRGSNLMGDVIGINFD